MAALPHRADWMAKGTYGLMVHYLIAPAGAKPAARTANLNQVVDAFDLDCFMQQFAESGADWLIFTIGQCTGYYCSPNEFLDRAAPGHTAQRDLILEIARRVKALSKRFIAYIPLIPGTAHADLVQAFAWSDDPDKHPEFLGRYQEFIRDYSLKLGLLCAGWWFDGAYDYYHHGRWDWARWGAAARAGNPDAIVAYNDGAFCVGREKPVTPLQDYHAGEVHLIEDGKIRFDPLGGSPGAHVTPDGKLRVTGQEPKFYMPASQFVNGVQWHALVPIDSSFNEERFVPASACHYPDDVLFKFVGDCKAVGGAVTLNLPIDMQMGHVPAEAAAQVQRLGAWLERRTTR